MSTWMFITELLIIAKKQKQPKCSCIDEWVSKRGNIHTWDIIWL